MEEKERNSEVQNWINPAAEVKAAYSHFAASELLPSRGSCLLNEGLHRREIKKRHKYKYNIERDEMDGYLI